MEIPNKKVSDMRHLLAAIITIASFNAAPSFAQAPGQYPPAELDRLVLRIALDPDPLLAQILAASTYPEQIPDASHWADDHHYLGGEPLARARVNRLTYVHPYAVPRYAVPRPPEPHHVVAPSAHEREQERHGEPSKEEHRSEEKHHKPGGL
jgi:hypothetical protein